jgi:hypothetical protein
MLNWPGKPALNWQMLRSFYGASVGYLCLISLKWKGIKIKITRVFNGIISIGFQATYWQKNAIRNKTTGNNSY